ncbi:hypothetical protein V493_03922 [Pseudogymnoascus sp. VKM F-4281 (FW-2241)]|nr:hypothetical protein V493_03922 [Pseudogymnoascus sp. VKM F-4281 (FW-2241)]
MLTTSILAAAFVAGTAIAQSTPTTTGSNSVNYTYVDPSKVDPQISASWCIGQRTGCQTLCDGNAPTNNCDPKALTYACLCADGTTPNLADYKNTLPQYVCQEDFAGCINAHPNDAVGQGKCKTEIEETCGTKNITDYEKGSGSGSGSKSDTSSGSASETATPSSGGAGGASETTGGSTPSTTETGGPAAATSDSAAVALINGVDISAGVLAAGLLAVFGYIL